MSSKSMMNFHNFNFEDSTNHFIAMQYYRLMLNRTYFVINRPSHLIGIKVNGTISSSYAGDAVSQSIINTLAVFGDLTNPYNYLNHQYLQNYNGVDLFSQAILNVDKANFFINKQDVQSVIYNPKKKFGMAEYPHDGRVVVKTLHKKYEFIILGSQSGAQIVENIQSVLR